MITKNEANNILNKAIEEAIQKIKPLIAPNGTGWEASVNFTLKEINSDPNIIVPGDYIKVLTKSGKKKHIGVVNRRQDYRIQGCDPEPGFSYIYHNGIKPSSASAPVNRCIKITKDEFIEYIKKSGCTSMREYL